METSHGNHFGFYEGSSIFDAWSNEETYTYPAKLADILFSSILERDFQSNGVY